MKSKKKEEFIYLLGISIFIFIGLMAMCYRAEQINKKELPVAKQSNSANF